MWMAKTWVLDTETKGTGAQMVPIEKVLGAPEDEPKPAPRKPSKRASGGAPKPRRRPAAEPRVEAGPLPPGHVRTRATGEIGRVRSVDPKAGQATVHWLRRGRTSTVPLSAITRS